MKLIVCLALVLPVCTQNDNLIEFCIAATVKEGPL
jgi:hypothetical protein